MIPFFELLAAAQKNGLGRSHRMCDCPFLIPDVPAATTRPCDFASVVPASLPVWSSARRTVEAENLLPVADIPAKPAPVCCRAALAAQYKRVPFLAWKLRSVRGLL